METPQSPQASTPTIVDFGLIPEVIVPCTKHTCPNGHTWSPKMALVACPGCKNQILAIMMVNCPMCNEPTAKTEIRCDHMPQGGAITPICKGSGTLADVTTIEMAHTHAARIAEAYSDRPMIGKV